MNEEYSETESDEDQRSMQSHSGVHTDAVKESNVIDVAD